MKMLLIELRDLLAFQAKQAKRHDLDEIRITVPRAARLIHQINDELKTLNKKIQFSE